MTDHQSQVTTHVLDATSGRPAAGVEVTLERHAGQSWQLITSGRTDTDGRITAFGPAKLERGMYRVSFAVAAYFAARQQPTFYPEVVIMFTLDDEEAHYHVPLLLSPYAYTTYRGS
jgi:5-hydroxyisourate hydrolase